MDEVGRWVFTICCGAALCGVVSVLLPSKGMEKLMRMVLGLFMLCCFLLPAGLELDRGLARGEFRMLTEEEAEKIRSLV